MASTNPSTAWRSASRLLPYCRKSNNGEALSYNLLFWRARGETGIAEYRRGNNVCMARCRGRDTWRLDRRSLHYAPKAERRPDTSSEDPTMLCCNPPALLL